MKACLFCSLQKRPKERRGKKMGKKYCVVKVQNLLNGKKAACRFISNDYSSETKNKLLKGLENALNNDEKGAYKFVIDEVVEVSLPNFSKETIEDLSRLKFSVAYIVCKKDRDGDHVLNMSLLKDTALLYRRNLPDSTIRIKGKEFNNPKYTIKEVKILLV